jgi:acyl-CoA thioesterase FadM
VESESSQAGWSLVLHRRAREVVAGAIALERAPASTSRISARDCDVFGDLHQSRYIDLFLEAREHHLITTYDFDPYEYTRETGHCWVAAHYHIVYLQPARFRENVVITTRLIGMTERDLVVEFVMYDAELASLKAVMWSEFRALDILTGRAAAHGAAFHERFAPIVAPLPARTDTLKCRVRDLQDALAR